MFLSALLIYTCISFIGCDERFFFLAFDVFFYYLCGLIGSLEKVIVDDFVDGILVCRSEFESPEVDGEILVRPDKDVIGDLDPYSLIGEFLMVRVTGADEYDLIAEPVEIL